MTVSSSKDRWTTRDVSVLNELWASGSKEDIESRLCRSWKAIQRKAENLGLTRKHPLWKNDVQIVGFPSWLQGEMVSDGHISREGRYRHTSKYPEYIDFLASKFEQSSVSVLKYSDQRVDKRTGKTYHRTLLATHNVFKAWRSKWYPHDVKVVPSDFCLDEDSMFHWILGDGSIDKKCSSFVLATMSFDPQSVSVLVHSLRSFGIVASVTSEGNLYVSKLSSDLLMLKKVLQKDFPMCYLYKQERLTKWINKKGALGID